MSANNNADRREQVTAILQARLRHAREPAARRMFEATLEALSRGADPDIAEAARRRAWASHLDELDEPDRIIERLEAELAGLTPGSCV